MGTEDEATQLQVIKQIVQGSDVAITVLFMRNGSMDVSVAGARIGYDKISDMLFSAAKECTKHHERMNTAKNN